MIRAKKSLGQNFLVDKNIINKIVNIVDIKDKNILEIGPSYGFTSNDIYDFFSTIINNAKKFILLKKELIAKRLSL